MPMAFLIAALSSKTFLTSAFFYAGGGARN
jgi:hypothetical protein